MGEESSSEKTPTVLDRLFDFQSRTRRTIWLAAALAAEIGTYTTVASQNVLFLRDASYPVTHYLAIATAICLGLAGVAIFNTIADFHWRAAVIEKQIRDSNWEKLDSIARREKDEPNVRWSKKTGFFYVSSLGLVLVCGVLIVVFYVFLLSEAKTSKIELDSIDGNPAPPALPTLESVRVLFPFGKHIPFSGYSEELRRIANKAQQSKRCNISLDAYADRFGPSNRNFVLSQIRGGYVQTELLNFGVDGRQMKVIPHGEWGVPSRSKDGVRRQANRVVIVALNC